MTANLRGSTLLLAGRVLALVIEFAAHVVIVRHLDKAEFGAFAYALSMVALLSSVAILGLPETVARYAPTYLERRQFGRLVGSVVVAGGVVVMLGGIAVLLAVALPGQVGEVLDSRRAATVLAVLVLMVPADGVNLVFQGLYAALGRVRLIFVRQYVMVPVLRLTVAIAVVLDEGGAVFVAVGYVVTSAAGLLWYAGTALPMVTGSGRRRLGKLEFPFRETLAFALPVFLTNVFWIVLLASGTLVLGTSGGTGDVASFQAVLPVSRLNYLVTAIFSILFIPTIARMYARGRFDEMRDTYLVNTYWMVVLTVPLLALTTVFAPTFVPAFFGDEYASSTSVLVLLACGWYVHSAAGPNSTTLKVYRRLGLSVAIDSSAVALAIVLNVVLIPPMGADGAGVAFLLAVIGRNLPYQWALWRVAGITLVRRSYLRLQLTVAAVLLVLGGIQILVDPGVVIAVVLSGLGGLAVLVSARRMLAVAETFPELARGPLRFLTAPPR